MSRAQGPGLFFQNENLNIHNEGGPVRKKTNNSISKTSPKKVGKNRRALQDLSNSGLVNKKQNLKSRKEGSFVKKRSDNKTSQKKVGGNRKALQDLSNSLSVHPNAATKKKNLSRGEFSVPEERFLHNLQRCTTSRKAEMDRNIHDEVLLAHGRR
ncbi:hypothetical protein ACHQM5_016698 [Ranunculus cassubicifolius]